MRRSSRSVRPPFSLPVSFHKLNMYALAAVARIPGARLLVVLVILAFMPGAWAQSNYKTLHKFTGGADGGGVFGGLILDAAGNLYGTTGGGGANRDGTVFKLTPNTDGSWTEKVLHNFIYNQKDGIGPNGPLIFDQAGNLYGTTDGGGTSNWGTVFELTPNQDGTWSEKVLYSFLAGSDGGYPLAGLVFDAAGNLYGTTLIGGSGVGVVFKLTPKASGRWREDVIYTFICCSNGIGPASGLVFDAAGDLYGTTNGGGVYNCGIVFELTPNQDGTWSESVIHSFTGQDGSNPRSYLILDKAGNIYGTTPGGGFGQGVAFILTPKQDGTWTEKVIHHFNGMGQGGQPYAGLTFDGVGNLYGTTRFGGAGYGVVFKLSPNSNGGWQETILHRFFDHPGAESYASVIFDAAQNLYGTTGGDGVSKTFGSVFKITP